MVPIRLPVVGRAVVVRLRVGRGRGAVLLARAPETHLGGGGRDAGAEEAVLVAPDRPGLPRFRIRPEPEPERGGGPLHVLLAGVLSSAPSGDHLAEAGRRAARRVAVHVGDQRLARHRRMGHQPLRAEQPFLLAGDEGEEHRATRALRRAG